jgi:hypothetical protein
MTTSPTRNNDVMAGTARLLARRALGETFSCEAIARECGVHKRTIQNTESRALYKVAHRLKTIYPGAIEHLLGGTVPMEEFFKVLSPRIKGPTGRPDAKLKNRRVKVPPSLLGQMSFDEIRKQIYRTRPDRIPSIREKQLAFHAKQAAAKAALPA